MQQTIAEHLNLDLSTVQNFFMNARRRSRIEQPDGNGDSPTPFQQVRPITPPPAATISSPQEAGSADPNYARSMPGNLLTPSSSATVFKQEKPKRPTRRQAKQKAKSVDAHSTFEPSTSTTNNRSINRLAFSGTSMSPAHGILDLPTLALRNDGESVNGGEDVEGLMLDDENEDGEDEYVEEDDEEEDGQSHDEAITNILRYGECPSPGRALGQGESTTGGQTIVISTSATMDVKPQRL